MKAVIQRVLKADIKVKNENVASIDNGLLVFIGVAKGDNFSIAELMCRKIIDLRIFDDANGKMNLSLSDIRGSILFVSQFTLCADNNKSGNRPSFINAEEPQKAKKIYEHLVNYATEYYDSSKIQTGVFAAEMKVNLTNDGPVTIILER
ncbi:D-tyrosyl-tRNA(Tyr) deacylase [Ignavibacteria bacterium CHB1]|nr:MAG: D-tyrosyl-tRNA(Tyr) deacylase [Chlorobiota bacterium]MBV6398783.1 D-aminoacyl-tRNA deacylase [Ignavibacteria bacterium]MCC6885045.1 D-tyrosyl-tRNA(Tyr) deacylase [Ignavibacteriales bacterium]MCE7952164.1 D-tyrosyl-tRNA(Tyr) deacylase [Chlorobi bacterium CHB7]MDL1886279.1 D-tyrosyl-tRNA(Tyr) deacylase [Ignavibacteria bacterium CHB1]RIK49436.1 MAG: D-tyrosyl-tRNA(Tyr) deacylase [Ignavibacteriota bacterium]